MLEQAIQALGGQTYLNVHTIKEQGRAYSFYHGRPTGNGVLFWRFVEYPDQERIEVTPERDVAYLYVGNKGWELTYKGPSPVETKDTSRLPATAQVLARKYPARLDQRPHRGAVL